MTSRFVLPLADVGAGIAPSSGAQLFFYETGTTTPKDTYSDAAGTTPNANPVVANSVGVFPDIFISGTYKVVLKNADGVQQWATDPVASDDSVYVSKTELAALQSSTLAEAVANTDLQVGQTIRISDRGNGLFNVVLASGVSPNGYQILQCTGVPSLALVLIYSKSINVNEWGMFADNTYGLSDGTDWTSLWLYIIEIIRPAKIEMPSVMGKSYRMQLFKIKAESEVVGDGLSASRGTIVELFYTGAYSSRMCQINSNTRVYGVRVESQEADLSFCSATVATAENVLIEKCGFMGFRNPTGSNSWGMYIDAGSKNIKLLQCAFDSNTQSDIAIVQDTSDIVIEGCYSESGTLDINIEPNTSSNLNAGVILNTMSINLLSMQENGTGGTANSGVYVNSCNIENLFYDGAFAILNNCTVNNYITGTELFMGSLKLENTLALSQNLVPDPYVMNNGFDITSSTTNKNNWYMQAVTGAIGTNQLDALIENNIRFTRINPTNALGTVILEMVDSITVLADEYYLVAITGRRVSGTSGAYAQINMPGNFKSCRLFRQSNSNNNHFTTEVCILKAVSSGNLKVRVGLWQNSTDSVDIHAVTVHKVLGKGASEHAVLGQYHSLKSGVRELNPMPSLPTLASADMNGLIAGDRVTLSSTGAPHYWSGSAWVAL